MRAVDTNVLVRLIARDNDAQVDAAEAIIQGGAWVSHLALAEAVWVLQSFYERGRQEVIASIERLLDHQHLVVQEPDVVRAALSRFRERRNVDLSDCLLVEIARKAGHLPLSTFDRDLAKLDGAELIRR
jgi:predicted nucleic-acid-binding protein